MLLIVNTFTYNLISALVILLLGYVLYIKWSLTYWKRKGLNYLQPEFFFGNTKKICLRQLSIGEQFLEIHKKFTEQGVKHGGGYMFSKPFYMPVEPELVKNILTRDFAYFVNRGWYVNEHADPLGANLVFLWDEQWRSLRTKLTPTFTSGKMKMMFDTIKACSKEMLSVLDIESQGPVNINDVLARFGIDIIGSCAFGVDCNTLKNPKADFRKYSIRVFESNNLWEKMSYAILQFVPQDLLKKAQFKITKPDVENFFMKTVKNMVEYRESNNIYRKDFMHLLIQLKNRGKLFADNKLFNDDVSEKNQGVLTLKQVAAQAYIFFIAGYETSSSAITFALLELSRNPEVQNKLREEINRVLEKHNNKMTYAAIMEMNYLEKVIYETMRLNPPVPWMQRICNSPYKLPGTSVTLEPGTKVHISVWGLHTDPEYWPNPTVFDPERFNEENKATRPACCYLPFGEGPRTCIGLRFAMLEAKTGLVAIIKNYRVSLNEATKLPFETHKETFVHSIKNQLWLDMVKIE